MEDLGWLAGLIIVVALFALGAVVYRVRHPKGRPNPDASAPTFYHHGNGM